MENNNPNTHREAKNDGVKRVSKECIEWVKNINNCIEKCKSVDECYQKCNISIYCNNNERKKR